MTVLLTSAFLQRHKVCWYILDFFGVPQGGQRVLTTIDETSVFTTLTKGLVGDL